MLMHPSFQEALRKTGRFSGSLLGFILHLLDSLDLLLYALVAADLYCPMNRGFGRD